MHKRLRWAAIIVLLLAIVSVMTIQYRTHHERQKPNAGSFLNPTDQGLGDAVSSSKNNRRRFRGMLAHRTANGAAGNPQTYGSWGILIAEDMDGKARPGDVAYLARLGPSGGLMKVESVEGDKLLLSLGTLDPLAIRVDDRIETMPPEAGSEPPAPE